MTTRTLAGKTILVSGGSRGIGLAIALRAARDGANILLLAKTATPHPKLEGTIYTAAEQVEEGITTDFSGYRLAAREEDLDLDFFLPDAPLPARA